MLYHSAARRSAGSALSKATRSNEFRVSLERGGGELQRDAILRHGGEDDVKRCQEYHQQQ